MNAFIIPSIDSLVLSSEDKENIELAIRFINYFREEKAVNYNLPFEALISEVYKYLALNRKTESGDIIALGDYVFDGLKKMRELGIIKNGDLVVNETNIES